MIYLNHGFIVRFFVLFLQPAKFFERFFESEEGSPSPLKLPLPSRPSVRKPRPARILGGLNPTYTFCFSFFESPRRKNLVKRKKVCVGLPPSPRGGRRGELRAYDLVSSHHARGACEVIGFGSKCELGTINTPEWNLSVFSKPVGGTREARPTGFPPFFPTNLERRLRRRALFFRQEAGASQRFLWRRPFWQKGLNQKQFCPSP